MRQLQFRHRIGLLVLLAASGLISVTTVALVLGRRSSRQMSGIETRYVPLLELDRDLKMTFAQIPRALEDAAAAADEGRLQDADELSADFVRRLQAGAETIADNGGDTAALVREFRRYFSRARQVSQAIVSGTPAAQLENGMVAMHDSQQAFTAHLDTATSPDRKALAEAFATARKSQETSLSLDFVVAISVLSIMGVLSWRIIQRTVVSLRAVSMGVERLARGDLDDEIDVRPGDELGDLASQANQTAARLREYREQNERDDWIKTGLAELGTAIAGELEQIALADKAMRFLTSYLGGAAAAAFVLDGDRLERLDTGASTLTLDVDTLAQAARDQDVHVDGSTRGLAIVPLTYEGRTLGVIALASAQPLPERAIDLLGRARGVIGVAFRVVEAHRRAQLLLDETRRQAGELRDAYDTLAVAKDAADAANRELEAFSYSVSHDLRSPLRAIDGFSQALLERHLSQLDAKGADYLKRVRAAAQRMGELIDALLQLSHINRAQLSRARVDLSEIGRGLADELSRRAPERHVTFAIASGLSAEADGRLVRALLDNLLGNAWKFTARTGDARVELGVDTTGEQPVFFVRDNGAGFDMQYAAKLFAPFQRLHADSEFPGTGIGLATVRRIVDRHGGRVWAEGTVGRGATIFFTLAPPPSRGAVE